MARRTKKQIEAELLEAQVRLEACTKLVMTLKSKLTIRDEIWKLAIQRGREWVEAEVARRTEEV